ncbi:FtsX-like permease family protein [Candidatus Bathyarchaeota archaeon]|nr:FtsX-like permease family protein [Candidatus Bathyarchaeota archaeon]
MHGKKGLLILALLLAPLISGFCSVSLIKAVSTPAGVVSEDINEKLLRSINMANIKETIRYFSTTYSSRFIGTEGYYKATEYIAKKFEEYGLNVTLMDYNVTVPVSYGANLTVTSGPDKGLVIPLYPLMPNNVHPCMTPPGGITGPLVYAGDGSLDNVKGKDIKGSIILMKFNSRDLWLTYASLGAKAVIFLEPDYTMPDQVATKRVNVPLNFPRLMVKKEDSPKLLELARKGAKIRLVSDMRFEIVKAYNILGLLPGTDPDLSDQIVIISASYDTYSIVPDLAPGADYSVSLAVLLELAKYFTQNKPKHPVLFVAFSGLTVSESGPIEFTEELIFGDKWETLGKNIAFMIDLQLSSRGRDLAFIQAGFFYYFVDITSTFHRWFNEKVLSEINPKIQQVWTDIYGKVPLEVTPVGIIEYMGGGMYPDACWAHVPEPYLINSESWIGATGLGVTLKTADVITSDLWGTPLDTFDRMTESSFNNIRYQYEYVLALLSFVLNQDKYDLPCTLPEAKSNKWLRRDESPPGESKMFVRSSKGVSSILIGQVVKYNYQKAKYEPVPNAIVYVEHYPRYLEFGAYGPQLFNFRIQHEYIALTDENGTFTLKGLMIGPVDGYGRGKYIATAYVIEKNGSITYAPDLGFYGAGSYPLVFEVMRGQLGTFETPRRFVVAKFGSLALFSIFYPYVLRGVEPQDAFTRSIKGIATPTMGVQVLDSKTHFTPLSYGYIYDDLRGVAMVFLPLDIKAEIVLRDSDHNFMGILTNSTEDSPMGTGFKTSYRTVFVKSTITQIAIDTFRLNNYRFMLGKSKGVSDIVAEELIGKSKEALEAAMKSIATKDYKTSRIMSLKSLYYSIRAYAKVVNMTTEILNATVFFFALLVPFAFLAERLFFHSEGYGRIIGVFLCFVIPAVILYFFHPGFSLASQVFALLMGFLTFILTMPVLILLFYRAFVHFRELRAKEIKAHEVEVGRLGKFIASVTVGIENMRKRKFRMVLTLLTLVLLSFSMIAAMSMSNFTLQAVFPGKGIRIPYNGLFIRRPDQFLPLSDNMITYITSQIPPGSIVAKRAAYYPIGVDYPSLWIVSESGKVRLESLWGLSPHQDEIDSILRTAMIKTTPPGRWFVDEDYFTCLISSRTAEKLKVSVGDTVRILGFDFTVIGIYNSTIINMSTDLDGLNSYPLNIYEATPEQRIYTYGDEMVIVPYKFVEDLGGRPYALSIKIEDPSTIRSLATEFANQLPQINIYAAIGESVYQYTVAAMSGVQGWQLLIPPLVIVALLTSNVMLGSVYERRREIHVFSSVGLSPMDVGVMFLTETIIYGVVAAVIGYVAGVVALAWVAASTPGFAPNYTSWMVVVVMLVTILTTVLSSIYPWREASRIVTPSLERRWSPPTKPVGDRWEVPLPFTLTDDAAIGALAFLREYFSTHTSEEAGIFVTRKLEFGKIEVEGETLNCLRGIFRLEPFRANIEHEAIIFFPRMENRRSMKIILNRTGGAHKHWVKSCYPFISELRSQMLLYSGYPMSRKKPYIDEGMKIIKKIKGE